MSPVSVDSSSALETQQRDIFGQPAGLVTLFFTELWERFSYYGMRALLMLYMVAPTSGGGLGFPIRDAATIYGVYTMAVYMTSIPGGFIADRFLGAKKAIFVGGSIIALGHFTLIFPSILTFAAGLLLIVFGTGLLKPNISAMVGKLYGPDDNRRDAGFSIFYMGINIGAAVAPIVCGFLAQHPAFKSWLVSVGLPAESSWHFGFAAAGVGMLIGLAHLVAQRKLLTGMGDKPNGAPAKDVDATGGGMSRGGISCGVAEVTSRDGLSHDLGEGLTAARASEACRPASRDCVPSRGAVEPEQKIALTSTEKKRLGAIAVLFVFNILFWAVYEQGGSSLNLFADKLTRNEVFGWEFPSSWFQSVPAIFVILLAPVIAELWVKLGDRQPSSPAKFAIGLLFLGLGTAIAVPATMLSVSGKVSPLWLVGVYFLQVVGELCLSPVGLSTVTKLAPQRIVGLTMGAWFVSMALGNYLAGWLAGFYDENNVQALVSLFGGMAGVCVLAALVLCLAAPRVRVLMSGIK